MRVQLQFRSLAHFGAGHVPVPMPRPLPRSQGGHSRLRHAGARLVLL